MSLLVIDFTFLEGRNGELVLKELADDDPSNRVSSYFLRDITAGKKCHCLTLGGVMLLTTGVIGMMVIYHIHSW